jgi:UDP-glucose 4-epimerase
MNENVVVTGGCGFIGSHLSELLLFNGYKVNIIDNLSGGNKNNISAFNDNPNLIVWNEDIRGLKPGHKAFDNAKYVFHLAGIGDIVPSIDKPLDYISVNVLGTVNVLECSRHANVEKFVYAASSSCYGIADTPTNEEHPINPLYPYAISKFQGEQLVFHWNKVYELPTNSICIFNAYGPRVRTTGAYGAVFGVFFKQKLSNKPLTIVGNGLQSRDFVFVTDVANAFLKAAITKYNGERYNLGSGNPQTIKYLAQLIKGDVTHIAKRPGEPECTFADISKIKSKLNWKPTISFEEGVEKMLQNIDYWKEAPLWDVKSINKATKTWFKYMGKKEK